MKKLIISLLVALSVIAVPCYQASASVSSTSTRDTYTADGATTVFDYTFPINSSSDIKVYTVDLDDEVTDVTSSSSVNTLTEQVTYPTSGSPATSGWTVLLVRQVPLTQTKTFMAQGPFPASSLNSAFDKLTMQTQQLQEQLNRALLLPISETSSPSLPVPEEGMALVWDANGDIVNSSLTGATGPQGPAGPAGAGTGDVLAPATNTDSKVPQWDGGNSKTLKDGLAVGTSANNLVQLTAAAKLPAVDGSLLTGVTASVASVSGAAFTSLASIPVGAGYIPSANINSLPDSSLATISSAGKVSGAALTSLSSIPFAAGAIPAANVIDLPDSSLYTISTAGKVSGAALTSLTSIPSGAGVIPSANLPLNNYTSASTYYVICGGASTATTNTSPTKLHEFYLTRAGSLSIAFRLSRAGGVGDVYSQIYRNGSPVGTQRTVSGTPTTFTETVTGWVAGDLLQIYSWVSGATMTLTLVSATSGTPSLETGVSVLRGIGVPDGTCGNRGDLYTDSTGGASTTLYVKTAASTWTAK